MFFAPRLELTTMPVAAPKPKRSIDVRDAVQRSRQYAIDLFPGLAPDDISLEEVRQSEDETCWLVTLGLPGSLRHTKKTPLSQFNSVFGADPIFKQFMVRKRDGQVLGMEIRQPA